MVETQTLVELIQAVATKEITEQDARAMNPLYDQIMKNTDKLTECNYDPELLKPVPETLLGSWKEKKAKIAFQAFKETARVVLSNVLQKDTRPNGRNLFLGCCPPQVFISSMEKQGGKRRKSTRKRRHNLGFKRVEHANFTFRKEFPDFGEVYWKRVIEGTVTRHLLRYTELKFSVSMEDGRVFCSFKQECLTDCGGELKKRG